MKKEDFLKLGIDEELATLCEQESLKELEGFVSKVDYEEAIFEKDEVINNLENQKNELSHNHKEEITRLKRESAVDIAINKARGKNLKAVKALMDLDGISIDENGVITGLDEQIEKLTKEEQTKFLFEEEQKVVLKGVTPSPSGNIASVSKEDFKKMNYGERVELLNNNRELYNELSV